MPTIQNFQNLSGYALFLSPLLLIYTSINKFKFLDHLPDHEPETKIANGTIVSMANKKPKFDSQIHPNSIEWSNELSSARTEPTEKKKHSKKSKHHETKHCQPN